VRECGEDDEILHRHGGEVAFVRYREGGARGVGLVVRVQRAIAKTRTPRPFITVPVVGVLLAIRPCGRELPVEGEGCLGAVVRQLNSKLSVRGKLEEFAGGRGSGVASDNRKSIELQLRYMCVVSNSEWCFGAG
jgi:hypothetical protein